MTPQTDPLLYLLLWVGGVLGILGVAGIIEHVVQLHKWHAARERHSREALELAAREGRIVRLAPETDR